MAIGKERISIVLVGGIAYFSGNSQGLTSYFGLPASTATSLSGRWISIRPNQSGFKSVTSGLTLPVAMREVTPAGSLTLGKRTTQNRQATVSVQGSGSPSQTPTTLFIATTGRKLPVEAVTAGKNGELVTGELVTFSRWGEKLNLPKPTSVVPITALSALSSAQG